MEKESVPLVEESEEDVSCDVQEEEDMEIETIRREIHEIDRSIDKQANDPMAANTADMHHMLNVVQEALSQDRPDPTLSAHGAYCSRFISMKKNASIFPKEMYSWKMSCLQSDRIPRIPLVPKTETMEVIIDQTSQYVPETRWGIFSESLDIFGPWTRAACEEMNAGQIVIHEDTGAFGPKWPLFPALIEIVWQLEPVSAEKESSQSTESFQLEMRKVEDSRRTGTSICIDVGLKASDTAIGIQLCSIPKERLTDQTTLSCQFPGVCCKDLAYNTSILSAKLKGVDIDDTCFILHTPTSGTHPFCIPSIEITNLNPLQQGDKILLWIFNANPQVLSSLSFA